MPTPKRMVGTPRSAMPVEDGAGGGEGEAGVLAGRERAGPAVEELHRLGAGLDLRPERGHGHGGQPVGQPLPQVGVPVHQRLDLGEGAGRPALDGVAGHGEGRAGEPDQRHPRSRRAPGAPGRPSRRRTGASVAGSKGRKRSRSACDSGTAVPPRAHALLHLDAESDGMQRHDDVAEEKDGGIDAEAPDRLQGELGGEAGVLDRGQDGPGTPAARYSGSDRPACRMNQTGRAAHRLPSAGSHQVGHGVCRRASPERLDDDRGAVGADLGPVAAHLRRVEPHGEDSISTRASASSIIRLTTSSRLSCRFLVIPLSSPPASDLKAAPNWEPMLRERTVRPKTSPSTDVTL